MFGLEYDDSFRAAIKFLADMQGKLLVSRKHMLYTYCQPDKVTEYLIVAASCPTQTPPGGMCPITRGGSTLCILEATTLFQKVACQKMGMTIIQDGLSFGQFPWGSVIAGILGQVASVKQTSGFLLTTEDQEAVEHILGLLPSSVGGIPKAKPLPITLW